MNVAGAFEIFSEATSVRVISLAEGVFIFARNIKTSNAVGIAVYQKNVDKKQILDILKQSHVFGERAYTDFKVVGEPMLAKKVSEVIFENVRQTCKVVEKNNAFVVKFDAKNSRIFVERDSISSAMEEGTQKKIRILIVDDSKTVRNLLKKVFEAEDDIEVVGDCELPSLGLKALDALKPDVVTLDLHMPEMNGVEFLKEAMKKHKIPTVVISSVTMEEGPMVFNALEAGAVDYAQKPTFDKFAEQAPLIVEKIRAASRARVRTRSSTSQQSQSNLLHRKKLDTSRFIAIGSSTGGTEAVREILTNLPDEIPPILIVQHIPPVFSKAFADRLNNMCSFEVLEAVNELEVVPNRVIIAAGGTQMKLVKRGKGMFVEVTDDAPVNRHKPSVDYLFQSISEYDCKTVIGVILTGMGADGAKGLLKLKSSGALTIAQDEQSCVVFGMPREAIKLGAASKILPLTDIAGEIIKALAN